MELLEWHRCLLSDIRGQERFRAGLRRVIKPGDVVLDIGAGTGIHTLFSLEAGASKAVSIEPGPIVHMAREIFRENGVGDRVRLIEQDIATATPPGRVDVAVSHRGPETAIALAPLLKERWLKPGGKLVPFGFRAFAAPVTSSEIERHLEFWRGAPLGFCMASGSAKAANSRVIARLDGKDLLANRSFLGEINYLEAREMTANIECVATREGTLNGFGFWYEFLFADGVSLDTGPECELDLAIWPSFLLPIAHRIELKRDDKVKLRFQASPDWRVWSWSGRVQRGGRVLGQFAQNTLATALPTSTALQELAEGSRQ